LKCFGKVELIDVVNEREFFTKSGQHLNSRDKESIASRISRAIDSMIKGKVVLISIKWYSGTGADSQKCQHQAKQEMTRFDVIITNEVHSANVVKEIGYPGVIKASDGDTVSDEKNVNPIKRTITGSMI
jgi:hypothetical protein